MDVTIRISLEFDFMTATSTNVKFLANPLNTLNSATS
jgi:hypothetical protein